MHKKEWSLKKKIIVGILVAAVIFGLIIGAVYLAVWSNRGTVLVIPVTDVLYGDFDNDDFGVQGTISTGEIQNIRKDEGTVSKIFVSEGDHVNKGDVLVQFETTTEDLSLKQAEIDLESRKLDLTRAQQRLDMLNSATPYVEPPEEETDVTPGEETDVTPESDGTTDDSETPDNAEVENAPVVVNVSGEALYSISNGEVLTETELIKGKNDATAAIATANTEIKSCQQNIEAAKKELTKRKVTAEFSGYITKVNDDRDKDAEQNAEENGDEELSSEMMTDANQENILVQLSSEDGLFVKSYINEWKKEQMDIGDTVYIMNWYSGETYEASITSVSDQISESMTNMYSQWYGTSASYYPFTAELKSGVGSLSSGDSVDVYFKNPEGRYSNSGDVYEEGRLNLIKAFVRTENGRKFVFVRGENGLLEKKFIKTDGQTQDCYIVTEGISTEDYIAFPYGKDVRNGAKVREGSISDLYGY